MATATCAATLAASQLISPTASADTPGATWTREYPASNPGPRSNASAAFHATSGKTVLFGGYNGSRYNDTWTWNGVDWTKESPLAAPSPRDSASMAYDEARGQVVLFGGWNGSSHLGDTWTWNGVTWVNQNPPTRPSNRYGAGFAYSEQLGQVILFGGWNGYQYLNDTWAWNGVTWVELNPATRPPGREAMAMRTDPLGRVLLFGGNAAGALGDTWTFDGITWTRRYPATNPPARAWPGSASDPLGRVVVFGGSNNGWWGDTWVWDGTTWGQRSTSPAPTPRPDAAMAADPLGRVLLYGGNGYSDTWTFTDTTPPTVPNPGDVPVTVPPVPPVTVPPLPPVTVPPVPDPPPLGGSGLPSDDCAGGTVVADGAVAGGYARVRLAQPAAGTTWVCVRVEGPVLRFGGKFVAAGPSVSAGPLPSTDTSADACTTTAGNTAPGPHPVQGGAVGDPNDPPYIPFVVDTYRNGSANWVCAGIGSVRARVLIPVGVGLTPPDVVFLPDAPATDVDVATPPATPSGTCQASGQATRHADMLVGTGRAFAYTWSPSPGVVKVCVRASGPATAGGVLTVDASNLTGPLPSVTTGTDFTPCTTQVLQLVNPPVTIRRSPGTATPASVCLAANGTPLRITVATGNGAPPAAVRWEPDPGTP